MRGADIRPGELFSYVDLEQRVPSKHPLRKIRQLVNDVLLGMDGEFAKLCLSIGAGVCPRQRPPSAQPRTITPRLSRTVSTR